MLSGWAEMLEPAAFAGALIAGPPEGQNVTFVRPDQWLAAWAVPSAEDAWRQIVRRYLRAYGRVFRHAGWISPVVLIDGQVSQHEDRLAREVDRLGEFFAAERHPFCASPRPYGSGRSRSGRLAATYTTTVAQRATDWAGSHPTSPSAGKPPATADGVGGRYYISIALQLARGRF
jgi:hypothetical protein